MNAEMRMYQALVNMPEKITSRSAKVNHIADWADVTWAYADAWLREWEKKQDTADALDWMQNLGQQCDNGAEVPYNGGEGFAFTPWDGEKAREFFAALDAGYERERKDRVLREILDENDPINPPHYRQGNVEAIDAICDALGDEQFKGYLRGNALKYLWRCELKGDPVENAKKAEWYVKRLIAEYELDEETRRDVND